jgi:hypothetical protein
MHQFSCESANKMVDVRQIPRWTRTYAASRRAITVALGMAVFLVLFAVMGGFYHFAGVAYRAGDTVLFWICLIPALLTSVAVLVGSIYFAVPAWGGKKLERYLERLFGEEGIATFSMATATKTRVWEMWVVGVLFGSCVVADVLLGLRGHISSEYMQPVSALYVVPLLLFFAHKMWPFGGVLHLIWPLLYALHAILIVAGAPILFTGKWDMLNILIPIAGYGMLASIIGFLYSRYALRRLRRLARIEPEASAAESETDDVDQS